MTDVTLQADAWKGVDAGVEAMVDKWLVKAGDSVRAGQPLANVVLVKSSIEVVAPAAGRVDKILVQAGDTFAKGKPIARLTGAA